MNKEIFNNWNIEKQKIHFGKDTIKYPKQREIWYTKLGINIGVEENGKKDFLRPVLIIKKIGILFFCIPLSTKNKNNIYYKKIKTATFYKNKYKKENSMLIISQGKTLDKKRFIKQMGYISKEEFEEIKNLLKNIYF